MSNYMCTNGVESSCKRHWRGNRAFMCRTRNWYSSLFTNCSRTSGKPRVGQRKNRLDGFQENGQRWLSVERRNPECHWLVQCHRCQKECQAGCTFTCMGAQNGPWPFKWCWLCPHSWDWQSQTHVGKCDCCRAILTVDRWRYAWYWKGSSVWIRKRGWSLGRWFQKKMF